MSVFEEIATLKFQDKMFAAGYCDARKAAFCAAATKLPKGKSGIVALCVKDDVLHIYEVDKRSNIGTPLFLVLLNRIENLTIKATWLEPLLQFKYDGHLYSFTNFIGVKPALRVIEEESQKR